MVKSNLELPRLDGLSCAQGRKRVRFSISGSDYSNLAGVVVDLLINFI